MCNILTTCPSTLPSAFSQFAMSQAQALNLTSRCDTITPGYLIATIIAGSLQLTVPDVFAFMGNQSQNTLFVVAGIANAAGVAASFVRVTLWIDRRLDTINGDEADRQLRMGILAMYLITIPSMAPSFVLPLANVSASLADPVALTSSIGNYLAQVSRVQVINAPAVRYNPPVTTTVARTVVSLCGHRRLWIALTGVLFIRIVS